MKKITTYTAAALIAITVAGAGYPMNNTPKKAVTAVRPALVVMQQPATTAEASDPAVSISKLPTTVKPYAERNFPGYHIKSAASDPLCDGSPAIDVAITKKGQPNFSLIFKPDGTFVQKEEDAPLATVPEKVREAFRSHFSGYTAAKDIEKLTLADNTVQYLLDITKGSIAKEAIFNADGTLVCQS